MAEGPGGLCDCDTGLGGCGLGACGFNGCNTDCCPDRGHYWVNASYLMWWQRSQIVPPLVTAGPPGSGAILGNPTTTILFDQVPNPMRSGGRFVLGTWLSKCD